MAPWRRLWLGVATAALPVLAVALAVLASGACGPGRRGHYPFLSECVLACKHSSRAWARAVPWIAVATFAAQLPSWLCTYAELVACSGDTRAAPAVVFGALALTASAGIAAVVRFELKADGFYTDEHVAGAAAWIAASFLMHALTLLVYARLHRHHELYTDSARVYIVLALVFMALYIPNHPAAAPVQWAMVFPLLFMCAANLAIGFRLARPPPDADGGP